MKKQPTHLLALAMATFALPSAAIEQERTGEQIVKAQCGACHATGQHGAPRIDDRDAWIPRMRNGLDATVRSAIRGHGAMPARGGLADLTDTELRSAILYLFNSAGAPPKPAEPPALAPNQQIVDGIEVFLGVSPRARGLSHVNITLRDAQTHDPIGNAQVEVRVTNPVMGAESRKLVRTSTGGVVSYEGDFRITGREAHVVTVRIRRPETAGAIETRFDYKG